MKKIIIKKENAGIRLDKFLVKEFFSLGMTRGEIIRNIKSGNVLVNNKKVKPGYVSHQGDAISSKFKVKSEKLIPNRNIKVKIIHQDKNIIIIDKPAGVQVHPDSKEKFNTIANWLIAKFPEIKDVRDPSNSSGQVNLRPGIVHRLDKDTSGVMVAARNMEAFLELKKIFKEHKVEKKYLALVYGKLENKKGIIEKPIARAATYKKQVIAGRKTKTKIREAITHYKVLKEFKDYSVLEVTPKTGRMHQIRIHLFSIGHPIVGDKIYKTKRRAIPQGVARQLLHAKSLSFKLLGKQYNFQVDLPEDFSKLLTGLTERPQKGSIIKLKFN